MERWFANGIFGVACLPEEHDLYPQRQKEERAVETTDQLETTRKNEYQDAESGDQEACVGGRPLPQGSSPSLR